MTVKTLGLSPKLIAPLVTALTAVVVSWITTGELNRIELAILATAIIGALAAYLAPPGEVTVPDLEALPFDADDAFDGDTDGDQLERPVQPLGLSPDRPA